MLFALVLVHLECSSVHQHRITLPAMALAIAGSVMMDEVISSMSQNGGQLNSTTAVGSPAASGGPKAVDLVPEALANSTSEFDIDLNMFNECEAAVSL